ncbi:MAG: alpha/beta hydrolase [Gammaproteobacteria bacterium]|nr:alpha/beta hydrolase [Gammaproteobacteria bacterium]
MSSEVLWEIPEPASVCEVRPDGDTVINLRRYGNPAGPRLVLSHGNGLAIDLYFPFWSLLMDDYDLVIYDLRNHGRNNAGAIENHNVPAFVRDHNCILAAIDKQYGEEPKIGVFHSASSLITLMSSSILAIPALTLGSSAFSALVLFDPPLCKPGASQEKFDEAAEKMAAMTRRRSNRFKSREQYVELLEFMPPFRNVVSGVRELVAATTLREAADGNGYELCCPPEYEARIIDYIRSYSPLVDLDELHCPTKVIGADPTLPYSYLPTIDLSDILSVDYDFLPDTTHLMQLEQPEECVATMRDFIEQEVLPGSR